MERKYYSLSTAEEKELDRIFSLYVARVRFMDEKGIRQWNVTDYLSVYPKEYYAKMQRSGFLYSLKMPDGKTVGAVVLLDDDGRWNDDKAAVYIHNLVTDPAEKGAGKILLALIEKFAAEHGKTLLRLDYAADSAFLKSYYTSLGFIPVGVYEEGAYRGTLAEKNIVSD